MLEAEELQLGLVSSIVGLRAHRGQLRGEANHAGTTPMRLRRDALIGAARALTLRNESRRGHFTANVGKLRIEPGGANIIPGLAEFSVDLRSTSAAGLIELEHLVAKSVATVAEEERLTAQVERTFALDPLELDATLVEVLERAAAAREMLGGG